MPLKQRRLEKRSTPRTPPGQGGQRTASVPTQPAARCPCPQCLWRASRAQTPFPTGVFPCARVRDIQTANVTPSLSSRSVEMPDQRLLINLSKPARYLTCARAVVVHPARLSRSASSYFSASTMCTQTHTMCPRGQGCLASTASRLSTSGRSACRR